MKKKQFLAKILMFLSITFCLKKSYDAYRCFQSNLEFIIFVKF